MTSSATFSYATATQKAKDPSHDADGSGIEGNRPGAVGNVAWQAVHWAPGSAEPRVRSGGGDEKTGAEGESGEGLLHWGRRASVSVTSRFCWLNSSRLPQSAGLDPSAVANRRALGRHRPSCRLGLRAKRVGGLTFHLKGWRPCSCGHVSKTRDHSLVGQRRDWKHQSCFLGPGGGMGRRARFRIW